MKRVKLLSMIWIGITAVLFFATVSKGASFGQKVNDTRQNLELNHVVRLTGTLNKTLTGNYNLLIEIAEDRDFTELVYTQEFAGMEIKEGIYQIPLNLKEACVKAGKNYWLKVSQGDSSNLLRLALIPSLIIQDSSTDTLKIENIGNGLGVVAVSTAGVGLQAQTVTGQAAIQATHLSGGTAILAEGNVSITGDLNVDGKITVSNMAADSGPESDPGQSDSAEVSGVAKMVEGDLIVPGNLFVQGTGNSSFAGKVGIGTSNPSAKLEVSTSGQDSAIHIDADANRQSVLYFLSADSGKTALRRPANSNDLRVFASANQNDIVTFKNDGTGNVGIGTTDPLANLHVFGTSAGTSILVGNNKTEGGLADIRLDASNGDGKGDDYFIVRQERKGADLPATVKTLTNGGDLTLGAGGRDIITLSKLGGNVGIGNSTPFGLLQVGSNNGVNNFITLGGTALTQSGMQFLRDSQSGYDGLIYYHGPSRSLRFRAAASDDCLIIDKNGIIGPVAASLLIRSATKNYSISFRIGNDEHMRIDKSGFVGIGTASPQEKLHVIGDIKAQGTIEADNVIANYQDLAEWVPSFEELEAGMVVVIDQKLNNHVAASRQAYDPKVAGVVSEKPGLLLGKGGKNQYMIASTGRVKVKVDAQYGEIQTGDLLVTSPEVGVAMKSQPMDFNGRPMHQPGTILGKALEPLSEGTGEILVLLSLQ